MASAFPLAERLELGLCELLIQSHPPILQNPGAFIMGVCRTALTLSVVPFNAVLSLLCTHLQRMEPCPVQSQSGLPGTLGGQGSEPAAPWLFQTDQDFDGITQIISHSNTNLSPFQELLC